MMALPLSFLSTPSARRATAGELLRRKGRRISIHALREEGDVRRLESARTCTDFYPRPPRGGRLMTIWALQRRTIFLSTPSARRATTRRPRSNPQCGISIHALREEGDTRPHEKPKQSISISIHALREEGDVEWAKNLGIYEISIHALREEGDLCVHAVQQVFQLISIHALREEGDRTRRAESLALTRFLSTPSARRATFPGASASP